MEQTYLGVVKDGVVLLPTGVELPEGTAVCVYAVMRDGAPAQFSDLSELEQSLLTAGLVREVKRPSDEDTRDGYDPIEVRGTPLSEAIIEDRR
jgi:hypothetical protein